MGDLGRNFKTEGLTRSLSGPPIRPSSPSDLTAVSPLAHTNSWGPLRSSNASDTKGLSYYGSLQLGELIDGVSHIGIDGSSHHVIEERAEEEEKDNLIESINDIDPFEIPTVFLEGGMLMLKVSRKSKKRIKFWVDQFNFKFLYKAINKNTVYEFYVDDIRDVSAREMANHYREELGISKEFERRWLSVRFFSHVKDKQKQLNVIADTSHDLKKILFTIENFRRLKSSISKSFLLDLKDLHETHRELLSGKAEATEKHRKEVLRFGDVQKYCRRLNINLNSAYLSRIFDQILGEKNETDFDGFKRIVDLIKERHDLVSIWNGIVGENDVMTFDMFQKFMADVQKEDMHQEACMKLYTKFASNASMTWSQKNWASFLKSKAVSNLKEDYKHEDYFKYPLNEYYILTSHNTYLVGRQIAGDSSVEGYVKALRRGCRCLEIDIWDNESDANEEPIVNHGRTFTNGISLSNVLQTIKRHAFQASPFPVILSLEIHCSQKGQLIIVALLKEIFGSSLILYPINIDNNLPSPAALIGKVLVKVKKTSALSGLGVDENGRFVSSSTTGTSFSESNETVVTPRKNSLKIRRKASNKVIDVLSDLGIYCQGLKFRNFSLPESKTYNHCFSLSEKSINTMLKDEGKLISLDKHNRKFFMRVYPSKTRLRSSNFLPINYWAHGVQMVATNWQTYDLGQQLNESLFESVCGRGYALKPLSMRKPLMKSSMRETMHRQKIKTRFKIEIVSAQMLPKPVGADSINPFVILDVIGPQSIKWDNDSTVGATIIVAENGFNPTWNQHYSGTFDSDNEFVFVRVTVHSSASTFDLQETKEIGVLVLNLYQMKQGYRYFVLKDSCGEQLLYSSLFMRIDYEYV